MELTETEQLAVKAIYNDYYNAIISADEALHDLEVVINGNVEELIGGKKE